MAVQFLNRSNVVPVLEQMGREWVPKRMAADRLRDAGQPDRGSDRTLHGGFVEIHEMEEIAWILRSDLKKNTVGFVKASDLKSKDRFVLPDEW